MTTKELITNLHICGDLSTGCAGCSYESEISGCLNKLLKQTAEQTEALATELEAERYRHDRLQDFEVAEAAELAKVKAERNAMLEQLRLFGRCNVCKHEAKGITEEPCCSCFSGTRTAEEDKWEWQGVNPNAD